MKVSLDCQTTKTILQIEAVIKAPKQVCWELLTTTQGYHKWFPEISADDFKEKEALLFDANGIQEDLPLFQLEEPYTLSYGWAEATVTFTLRELATDLTVLTFVEDAPVTFPDLVRDLAGWTLQMHHLRAIAEKRPYTFDAERFKMIEADYKERLLGSTKV